MVEMLVGHQDEIGLGERPVIGDVAVRVDVDRLSAKGHHQRPVAEEGDLEIALGGRDDVLLELHLAGGESGQAQDQEQDRQGELAHDDLLQ